MTEISAELKSRLVSGRKRDGRCAYDPVAKAELVQSCMQPGVSVARVALQCGINANLLRRWITQRMGTDMKTGRVNTPTVAMGGADAFVPLRLAPPGAVAVTAAALKVRLQARLPNGVEIDLSDAGPGELLPVIELLGRLPCSESTTR